MAAALGLALLWVATVAADGIHDVTNITESESSSLSTPPIPLRPEYAHPAGVEALDPYNSEKNPPPHDRDYEEEDYDHDHHKETDHENREADELPSLSGDHLLQSSTDDLPMFLLEPQHAFVVRNKPATLRCRAANALQVYFKCNGVRSVASTMFEFVDPQSGVRIVEAECNVTRDQLEEYFGDDRFSCNCYAWSSRGDIKSQPAVVELAYLKKQFVIAPSAVSVEAGSAASLRCSPPAAAPQPRVYWLKHGAPLQQDHNVLVSAEGNLLISRATLQDMANYTCVAENIAGKRVSEPALLTVYVNGGWSSWGPWTQCRCNGRVATGQRRTRTCTDPHPLNGGAPCQGQAVQRTADCVPCQSDGYMDLQSYDNTQQLLIGTPGRWGSWSEWSVCGADCRQSRRRACAGDLCSGPHAQHADCVGDYCGVHGAAHNDVPLYIGIAVAVTVFLAGSAVVYKLLQRKTRDHSLYTMTRTADFQPELYPTVEKQSLSLAPDLMQHRPPRYEHPAMDTRAEHHYDVPHLTNSYASPVDQQMTPCASSKGQSDEYDSKPYSESEHSVSSCFTSSGSMYDAANESVTLQLAELVSNSPTSQSMAVSMAGTRLALPAAGVALSVPENALARGRREQMYVAVVKDDRYRPRLGKGITQLSPVVKCGPPRLQLNKSVILQIPHCASLKHGFWNLSLFAIDHNVKSDSNQPQWKKIVGLGQETINTPVFTQLDGDKIFLVTDMLSTFVLVGESFNGKAVKALQLAIYAPAVPTEACSEYSIRVYVFEDTPCAMYYCQEQEKKMGGVLVDRPKTLLFQDGGSSLCLGLESVSPGWKAKPGNQYQEIPFNHVWNSHYNALHCSFVLERTHDCDSIDFTFSACQRTNPSYKQVFRISLDDVRSRSPRGRSPRAESQRSFNITENLLESRMCRSEEGSEGSAKRNITVTEVGVNECASEGPFKLSSRLKRQLCAVLDPPNARGNDWRALASRLGVDRYTTWFATKSSPTEAILELWECRERSAGATAALAAALRQMDRHDAADLLQGTPSWL
ncbi:netrin receptor UNC5B isoform X3 [Plutella xylostella]|uniref:netrin receptor UNC5B isoform X3 n=1 Tax=Plutella xylostella TaxID=51655 RepID=UPI002032CE4E|nr:netrin receptor UNC5B isoform X3 [Plutella xylostella]